jgi:hypothetical protein
MLADRDAVKGTQLMIDAIKEFSRNHNALVLDGMYRVSAKVNGDLIVDDETIGCIFTTQLDSVDISVYWEESGFKKYKKLGLYGKMNTKWQGVKRRGDHLYVEGKNYKSRIKLVHGAPEVDSRTL